MTQCNYVTDEWFIEADEEGGVILYRPAMVASTFDRIGTPYENLSYAASSIGVLLEPEDIPVPDVRPTSETTSGMGRGVAPRSPDQHADQMLL